MTPNKQIYVKTMLEKNKHTSIHTNKPNNTANKQIGKTFTFKGSREGLFGLPTPKPMIIGV